MKGDRNKYGNGVNIKNISFHLVYYNFNSILLNMCLS